MKNTQIVVLGAIFFLMNCGNEEPLPSHELIFQAEISNSVSSDIILTSDKKIMLLTREGSGPYTSRLYKLDSDYSIVWDFALDELYTVVQERPNGGYLLSGGSKVASVQVDGLGVTFMTDAGLDEFQVFEQSDGKIFGCGRNEIGQFVQAWNDFDASVVDASSASNVVDFVKRGNAYVGVDERATELQLFGSGMIATPLADLVGNPYSQFTTIDIKVDADGMNYVLGNTQSDVCLSNLALIKFDPFGQKVWIRELGSSSGSDFAGSLTMADDRVLVSGYYAEKGCTLNVNHTELYLAEISLNGKVNFELKDGERDVNEGIQKTLLIDGKLIGAGVMTTESGNSKAILIEVKQN